jgi:hypothetical protein
LNTDQTLFLKKRFEEAGHKISLYSEEVLSADILESLGKCLKREIACDIFVSKRGLEKMESDAFLLIHLLKLRKLGASIYSLLSDIKVSRYFIQETKNLMNILTILPQKNLSTV